MIGIESLVNSQVSLRRNNSTIMYISLLCLIVVSNIKLINYGILCLNHDESLHSFSHHPQNNLIRNSSDLSIIPNNTAQHLGRHIKDNNSYEHNNGSLINRRSYGSTERRQARAVYLASNSSNITSIINQDYIISSASSASLIPNVHHQNDQPPILDQCCACDEAKYELVFEGLWSRHTHPDEFPENYWLARFSDIIGASHSNEFRMWQQDSFATEGVKELAETGSTKKLEAELKQVSSKTRTIIKARELHHPTLNSKTSAVFRTDRHHHLVSILSKLSPSPDWMVGVSGLELCQLDCSWATQRIVNLYLWDAGTDSGNTFTSADIPTRPQDKIHPFKKVVLNVASSDTKLAVQPQVSELGYGTGYDDSTPTAENDQRRPVEHQGVVDHQLAENSQQAEVTSTAASEQTKPFARLTITRQRIYEKSCNGETVSPPRHQSYQTASSDSWLEPTRVTYSDCRYTDWSDWASCSSTCGKGIRTRTRGFLNEQAHLTGCSQIDLIEKEVCLSECVGNTTCVTQDWSVWSKCSVDCGHGIRKRTRSPIRPLRKACDSVELVETEPCSGSQTGNCTSDAVSPNCEVTDWSQWSDCSVACGKGTRIRTRQYVRRDSIENCNVKLIQKHSCTGRPELCKQTTKGANNTCTKPVDTGPCKASIERWRYDAFRGMCVKFIYGGCLGNANNFDCFHDCEKNCLLMMKSQSINSQLGQTFVQQKPNPDLPVIDCKLSSWSPWSTCSALCGRGKRVQSRYIIQMPQNGGKPCDKKLSRKQNCKDLPPCPHQNIGNHSQSQVDSSKHRNQTNSRGHKQQVGSKDLVGNRSENLRTTTTTTTPGSSMMDDEDDSKFSRLLKSETGLIQQPASFSSKMTSIGNGGSSIAPSEMIVLGSTGFHIRDGHTYLISMNATSKSLIE